MKRRLILRHEADVDMVDAATFIASDNPGAALSFLEHADSTIRRIHRSPFLGRIYGFPDPEAADLRCHAVSRFRNYLIFYRVTDTTIEIVRVVHGARNLPPLFRAGG